MGFRVPISPVAGMHHPWTNKLVRGQERPFIKVLDVCVTIYARFTSFTTILRVYIAGLHTLVVVSQGISI